MKKVVSPILYVSCFNLVIKRSVHRQQRHLYVTTLGFPKTVCSVNIYISIYIAKYTFSTQRVVYSLASRSGFE